MPADSCSQGLNHCTVTCPGLWCHGAELRWCEAASHSSFTCLLWGNALWSSLTQFAFRYLYSHSCPSEILDFIPFLTFLVSKTCIKIIVVCRRLVSLEMVPASGVSIWWQPFIFIDQPYQFFCAYVFYKIVAIYDIFSYSFSKFFVVQVLCMCLEIWWSYTREGMILNCVIRGKGTSTTS